MNGYKKEQKEEKNDRHSLVGRKLTKWVNVWRRVIGVIRTLAMTWQVNPVVGLLAHPLAATLLVQGSL